MHCGAYDNAASEHDAYDVACDEADDDPQPSQSDDEADDLARDYAVLQSLLYQAMPIEETISQDNAAKVETTNDVTCEVEALECEVEVARAYEHVGDEVVDRGTIHYQDEADADERAEPEIVEGDTVEYWALEVDAPDEEVTNGCETMGDEPIEDGLVWSDSEKINDRSGPMSLEGEAEGRTATFAGRADAIGEEGPRNGPECDIDPSVLAEQAMQAMLCGDLAKYADLNKQLVERQMAAAKVDPNTLQANHPQPLAIDPPIARCEGVCPSSSLSYGDGGGSLIVGGMGGIGASGNGLPTLVPDGREMCVDFKLGRCSRDFCRYSHGGVSPERSFSRASGSHGNMLTFDADGREMCGDFKAGRCNRDFCRFSHGVASLERSVGHGYSGVNDSGCQEMCMDFKAGLCNREFCRFSHGNVLPDIGDSRSVIDCGFSRSFGSTPGMVHPPIPNIMTNTADEVHSTTMHDQGVKVLDPSGCELQVCSRYTNFSDAPFPDSIMGDLSKSGFAVPSQIQQYTWPLAVQMHDTIGLAATGSGKTLAFLLPAFAWILQHPAAHSDPLLLVLAPTRELAVQIETEAQKFGKSSCIRTTCCYGGAPKHGQLADLCAGVQGVIGTPGRINDFLEMGQLRLDRVVKLVLDEADRMLDMGFEPQVRKILGHVSSERHTLLFSATWPHSVRRLASEFLRNPYLVQIGKRDQLIGNEDITQMIQLCSGHGKNQNLLTVLHQAGVSQFSRSFAKALVFCSTKRMCNQLAEQLVRTGVACGSIHGDKDQRQREQALNDFRSGRANVLVATDIAARGLDIKGVTLVVNYDAPGEPQDYVHRIGRTGRAGQKGCAVSLISERDLHALPGIISVMRRTNQTVTEEVERMARAAGPPPRKGEKGYSRGRAERSSGFDRSRSRERNTSAISVLEGFTPCTAPALSVLDEFSQLGTPAASILQESGLSAEAGVLDRLVPAAPNFQQPEIAFAPPIDGALAQTSNGFAMCD